MINTYDVIHDKISLKEEDIMCYLKTCKEKNCDHLYIELRHDNKFLDHYIIQWPDSKDINEYNSIRITIECSHNKFYCKNLSIRNYDDTYYEPPNNRYYNQNTIFINNVGHSISIEGSYSFYTTITIQCRASYIRIDHASYISALRLDCCSSIDWLQIMNGSFVDKLLLFNSIIEKGIYVCDEDKRAISKVVLVSSLVIYRDYFYREPSAVLLNYNNYNIDVLLNCSCILKDE